MNINPNRLTNNGKTRKVTYHDAIAGSQVSIIL